MTQDILTEKNTQCESCELSFMRTIVQEKEFQIALRNCSEEVGGKVSIYVSLVKEGTCNQEHIFAEG